MDNAIRCAGVVWQGGRYLQRFERAPRAAQRERRELVAHVRACTESSNRQEHHLKPRRGRVPPHLQNKHTGSALWR